MQTDIVVDGVLIAATCPPEGAAYEWPAGVTEIGNGAFNGFFSKWGDYNAPFVIPESIVRIGNSAFNSWLKFNQPFSIPKTVACIGSWAFSEWQAFDQPNCIRTTSDDDEEKEGMALWFRIDDWCFAGCYSGTVAMLRKRLDDGESTPRREHLFKLLTAEEIK